MNDDTLLLRVILIKHFDFENHRPKSCIMIPEEGTKSVYNGDLISPKDAYLNHTHGGDGAHLVIGFPLSIVKEFEKDGLKIVEDGLLDSSIHDSHVNLDFTAIESRNKAENVSRKIAKKGI